MCVTSVACTMASPICLTVLPGSRGQQPEGAGLVCKTWVFACRPLKRNVSASGRNDCTTRSSWDMTLLRWTRLLLLPSSKGRCPNWAGVRTHPSSAYWAPTINSVCFLRWLLGLPGNSQIVSEVCRCITTIRLPLFIHVRLSGGIKLELKWTQILFRCWVFIH